MALRAATSADALREQCRMVGLPLPDREVRFAIEMGRRWRFDLAWPAEKLAAELDGGVFLPGGGRHSRGAGFRADAEKKNAAAILGYHVLVFLPEQVPSGLALQTIERFFAARGIRPTR